MQAAGSLGKRRRRNLAKVTGIGTIGYQESSDVFNIQQIYGGDLGINNLLKEQSPQHGSPDPPIRMGNNIRPTRIPDLSYDVKEGGGGMRPETSYSPRRSPSTPMEEEPHAPPGYLGSAKAERPCLLSTNAVNRLRQVCIAGALTWALPWWYDHKSRRVKLCSPGVLRVWSMVWWVFVVQNTSLTGYQFYALLTRVQLDNGSYRPVFMNSLSLCWYLYSISLNTVMHLYREKFRCYINTLLAFNEKNVGESATLQIF